MLLKHWCVSSLKRKFISEDHCHVMTIMMVSKTVSTYDHYVSTQSQISQYKVHWLRQPRDHWQQNHRWSVDWVGTGPIQPSYQPSNEFFFWIKLHHVTMFVTVPHHHVCFLSFSPPPPLLDGETSWVFSLQGSETAVCFSSGLWDWLFMFLLVLEKINSIGTPLLVIQFLIVGQVEFLFYYWLKSSLVHFYFVL